MHIRVRCFGKPDSIVVVESKLTKIEKFRKILKDKFDVAPKLQRLFYGGKLLEDGYTFHDYNIKLNDVIQLMVRVEPQESPKKEKTEAKVNDDTEQKSDDKKIVYKDAVSKLYNIGDLVDFRDKEQGAWFDGKIVRIVQDPNAPPPPAIVKNDANDLENTPPKTSNEETSESTKPENAKGIAKYFFKSPKRNRKKPTEKDSPTTEESPDNYILFEVEDVDKKTYFCKKTEIRPIARTVIDIKDLKEGHTVMLNHNTDQHNEKGHWYDFTITEVVKLRTTHELKGTLFMGPEASIRFDKQVLVHDKIFAIEAVVPVVERTEEYNKLMVTAPEKRSYPLNCLKCRDDEEEPCKECGCFLCAGKESPELIVLCDECDNGFHMSCLTPPLSALPEGDWYCPTCKRDTNDVIAPGAAKQAKKSASKGNRDWGRGMACVGKTKTCAMPANHFGPIPGIEVGMCWRFRIQISESGVHRPPVSGIHGRDVEGAYSIVLSGGYEDDVDYGNEFTYTGSGGRDLSGNKRTAEQSCDQMLTRENKALARNCAVKQISEEGGDAGDEWRKGKPVRVVRSYKMLKHFPTYAPKEGIRYDGIYKVVKYYPEKGLSGYRVWKYLLRRDDPSPAPWEPDAKQYPIVYPDGYLEAEAEKKALKEKKKGPGKPKRALQENNHTESEEEAPSKKPIKKKGRASKKNSQSPPSSRSSIAEIFKSAESNSPNSEEKGEKVGKNKRALRESNQSDECNGSEEPPKKKGRTAKTESPSTPSIASIFKSTEAKSKTTPESPLTDEERGAIDADALNSKLWKECLEVCEEKGRKEFVEHVIEVFLCIICQEVAASPVTTPCLHNFCMACLKHAFKATSSLSCPYCRHSLSKYEPEPNDELKKALRSILVGYDAGRK